MQMSVASVASLNTFKFKCDQIFSVSGHSQQLKFTQKHKIYAQSRFEILPQNFTLKIVLKCQ